MPRRALVGFAILLTCLLAPLTWAQEAPAVKLEVRGMGGTTIRMVPRTFVSLRVFIENTSVKNVRGVLRAYRNSGAGRDTPALSLFYEAEIEVPRQGRRSDVLYYYVQDREPNNQLCVSFEPSEGEAPPPVFPKTVRAWDLQVLLLSRDGLAEVLQKQIEDLVIPSQSHLLSVDALIADPAGLPDHPAGYSPYGAVIYQEGELAAEQMGPLLEWVSGGGDLWVVSSAGRQPLPDALVEVVPVHLLGAQKRHLRDLELTQPTWSPMPNGQAVVLADRVRVKEGAYVVAGPKDAPLIVRGRYGAGWVTYFTFPLDSRPLKGWPGTRPLLRDLIRLPAEDRELSPGEPPPAPPLEELLLNLSEALENLEPPSTWIVAPLLIFYVALVGPLNFFFLRRTNKLAFSQITATAVAIAFGVAFYAIGVAYKGSESLVTQIGMVDLSGQPNRSSRVDVMTGYFSTGRGQTEATGPKGALVGPLAALKLSNREARLRRDGDTVTLERVSLDTWALRRFRSLRFEDVGHLEVNLSLKEERITGTIRNETKLTLKDPLLLFAHNAIELSVLEPGAVRTVDRVPPVVARGREPVPRVVKSLLKAARNRYHGYFGMETAGIVGSGPSKIATPTRRLYASWRRRLERVPHVPGHIPALFVAYSEASPEGLVVKGGSRVALKRTLIVREVQVALAPNGRFSFQGLPPEVALKRSQGDATWLPSSGETGTVPILQASGKEKFPTRVSWRWRLPASGSVPLSLTSLKFRIQLDTDTTKLDPKEIQLQYFSFKAGNTGWRDMGRIDKLPRKNEITSWPEPRTKSEADARTALHSTSGEIWIRLNNGSLTDLAVLDIRLDASAVAGDAK
ncbi:MAG: hypothetical protein JKY65_29205 [Planctomycetes bacterium]|nr:hypothetical protein [Planctomycetota bacterium]